MTDNKVDPINFQVGFGAVQHFGKNLYTTNPPAIAELIANGWDAYATEVEVHYNDGIINNKDNYLLVSDNGTGMSYERLSSRYAISGLPKPETEVKSHPSDCLARPIMGRKGIGKFAAFSLGDEYFVITRDNIEKDWICLKLNYEQMNELGQKSAQVPVSPVYYDDVALAKFLDKPAFVLPNKGTIVYIPKLRHRIITTSVDGLNKLLSRRFAANLFQSHKFQLKINNQVQDLKGQFYDNEIQFVHYFGYDETSKDKLLNRFGKAKLKVNVSTDFINQHAIKGWIGTVLEPKNLKIESQGDGAGVVVYINGKLADENVLRVNQNQNMGAAYIVGEIEADYLQTEDVDPVTSSREGLNHALDEVREFVDSTAKLRDNLVAKWKEYRGGDTKTPWYDSLHQIKEYESLYRIQPTPTRKRMDKIAADVLENKQAEAASRYYPLILSFALSDTIESTAQKLLNAGKNEDESVEAFKTLFDNLHMDDALTVTRTIKNRLDVIELLEQDMSENVLEATLEDVLADHPWLLNPFWDGLSLSRQDKLKFNISTGQHVNGRSDILVYTNENEFDNFPVIVELKRAQGTGHQTPASEEVIDQIKKYRRMLVEQRSRQDSNFIYANNYDRKKIPAYFIAGSDALQRYSGSDRIDFSADNIKLLSFNEIVSNAKSLYFQATNALKNIKDSEELVTSNNPI